MDKSFFTDCQALIEIGHEFWKSYFSKWEVFAKYEETIPESELCSDLNDRIKPVRKKKFKKPLLKTKSKALSLLTLKKNQRNRKKFIRRRILQKKHKPKTKIPNDCSDKSVKNVCSDEVIRAETEQLEKTLKTVFIDISKTNRTVFRVFAFLSESFVDASSHYLHPSPEDSLTSKDIQLSKKCSPLSTVSEADVNDKLICSARHFYIQNSNKKLRLLEIETTSGTEVMEKEKWKLACNQDLNSNFPTSTFNYKSCTSSPQFLLPSSCNQALQQTPQLNSGIRKNLPALCSRFNHESTNLKPAENNLSHESPNSMCRKINKEYFIKRRFPKMNITLDVKRFRNICLQKRTNSVSFSMENSNFITPEKKPPEWKCFSENILQRKRRRPSRLFFDNDGEDSGSDDQSKTLTPLIHCKNKKPKSLIISEIVVESDSDDCESIFDRVKKS